MIDFIRDIEDVMTGDPDGYYLQEADPERAGRVQVIVAGPARHTPAQMARALGKLLDREFRVVSGEFMTHTDPAQNEAVLMRGFVRLMFEPRS